MTVEDSVIKSSCTPTLPFRRSVTCGARRLPLRRAAPRTATHWFNSNAQDSLPSDVELVFLQPADALSAFTQRRVDVWAVWDPYTAQAETDLPVRSIARATGVTNGAGFGVASDTALADPKRNTAVSDLLVRYAKAVRWAHDNREQWVKAYAEEVGLAPEVAALAQGRSLRLPTDLSDQLVASEQELADLFAKSDQISSAPEFSRWVDRRYSEVLAHLYINRD